MSAAENLITEFNAAAAAANDAVRAPYNDAVAAVRDELAQVSESIGKRTQAAALFDMVMQSTKAALKTKQDKERAASLFGQYESDMRDLKHTVGLARYPYVLATNLAGNISRYASSKQPVLVHAVMGAVAGDVDAGLIDFPSDVTAQLTDAHLGQLARVVCPDELDALLEQNQKQDTRRVELLGMRAALEQAKPYLAAVGDTAGQTVTISSSRGPFTDNGVTVAAHGETVVTRDQYARLLEGSMFNSFVASGAVAVVAESSAVEEL